MSAPTKSQTNAPLASAPPTDLHEISAGIRGEGGRPRYLCLSSLLYAVGARLGADHVGILEDDPTGAEPLFRRLISVHTTEGSLRPDKIPPDMIRRHLTPPPDQYERPLTLYFTPVDVKGWGTGEAAVDGCWLILVPVWPSHFWGSKPKSRFWVYVWNPSGVVRGPLGSEAAAAVSRELRRLCVEWFAWKHDRLSNRARLREDPTHALPGPPDNDLKSAVAAVQATMVWPVQPPHLAGALEMLRRLRPKPLDGRWSVHAAELWSFAQRVHTAAASCGTPPCAGCDAPNVCPRAPELDDLNLTLTRLFVWETGFWHDLLEPPSSEFNHLLDCAVAGLRSASASLDLHKQSGKPLCLKEGRDRLLLRFFTARAIDGCLNRFLSHRAEGRTPLPEIELLGRLARLAVLLITDGEWAPDAIRNLIHVVAGYGHVVLGVPAWLDLARHLRQTLRGESALYTLKQRYRDHFFHTIEVCLIGFVLLTSRPHGPDGSTLGEHILAACEKARAADPGSPRFIPDDTASLLAQWWVAALLHDTAYGIDVLGGTLKLLDYFRNQGALTAFTRHVQEGVKVLHASLAQDFPELTTDPELEKGDHGLIAASHLLQTAQRHGVSFAEQLRPAARAIAFHNTKHPRIDAGRDPVAALLVLCDTVQDWGRSQLGFDRSPTVVLSRLVSPAPTPEDEQFGPVQRFSFSLTPVPQEDGRPHEHAWDKSGELEITLEYGERAACGFGLFYTWADSTHNLRRVVFAPWDLRLRVVHNIPLHAGGTRPTKLTEFARLLQRQEAGHLGSWVDEALSGTEGAPVRRELVNGHERITFDLLGLAETPKGGPLMGRTLSEFAAFLSACQGGGPADEDADPPQRPPV